MSGHDPSVPKVPIEGQNPEDPQAILGAITLRGLENLQAHVNQPWAGILDRERRGHEATLHTIWDVPSQPESPAPPENFDPKAYLTDIRKKPTCATN